MSGVWRAQESLVNFEKEYQQAYTKTWGNIRVPFKVFRMLIKIWKSDVLTKTLEDKLYLALERSLSEVHSDFVQQILDKSPMGDVGPTKAVLLKFFDSLLDLSINERTVHYLATSDVPIDGIYE